MYEEKENEIVSKDQSHTLMTLNGIPTELTVSELFSDKYTTMRFITFSFSETLVRKLQQKYDLKGIIGAPFNKSLKNDSEHFVYAAYRTHVKLMLLFNKDRSQTRIIVGSANLSYQGLSVNSAQDERIEVTDNNKEAFDYYYKYFEERWFTYKNLNSVHLDSYSAKVLFREISDLKKDKRKLAKTNKALRKENSSLKKDLYLYMHKYSKYEKKSLKNKLKEKQLKEQLIVENSPIENFINSYLEDGVKDEDDKGIKCSYMYKKYIYYCQQNNERVLSVIKFGKHMLKHFQKKHLYDGNYWLCHFKENS